MDTLHSNLVIFKFCNNLNLFWVISLYIPIWLYSNQHLRKCQKATDCLYIPIWLYSNRGGTGVLRLWIWALHSNLVIFKLNSVMALDTTKSLYIPIWLYSNDAAILLALSQDSFYIPIWLYSNKDEDIEVLIDTGFYIPIWLYSNWFTRCTDTPCVLVLHSNLVIFKWLC